MGLVFVQFDVEYFERTVFALLYFILKL